MKSRVPGDEHSLFADSVLAAATLDRVCVAHFYLQMQKEFFLTHEVLTVSTDGPVWSAGVDVQNTRALPLVLPLVRSITVAPNLVSSRIYMQWLTLTFVVAIGGALEGRV